LAVRLDAPGRGCSRPIITSVDLTSLQ
jgi:hypothetical protein